MVYQLFHLITESLEGEQLEKVNAMNACICDRFGFFQGILHHGKNYARSFDPIAAFFKYNYFAWNQQDLN